MSFMKRFSNLFRSERLSADIDREMTFHIAERTDDLMSRGMTAQEADRVARRQFGNTLYQSERTREADMFTSLETFWADVRYAVRALVASPLFAVIAILSLALGIGANTAIFSLINAVMLKTLPVQHPEQLVALTFAGEKNEPGVFTNPLWEAVRDREKGMFKGIFAYGDNTFDLAEGGEAQPVKGDYVSGGFFSALGVRPAAGRLLAPADDFRGCPGAAVIGHGMWQRAYGGEANVVGRTISLDGHRFPIVGVADRSFFGVDVGSNTEVYIPVCAMDIMNPGQASLDARSMWWLRVIARPADGISTSELRARLSAIAPGVYQSTLPANWSKDGQADYLKRKLSVVPSANGMSYVRGEYSSALVALMVIVSVVLLIACANVANLLLARATVRQRELAVRLAIGAGRWRIIRQLLTESLLLSLLGAALGVLFARWGSALLVSFLSRTGDSVWLDLAIDMRVLGFTIAVATFTGVLFGLAPAWKSVRVQPQSVMKSSSRSVIDGQSRFGLGKALVVAQIALSLVLVMGAALLLGSFRTLATRDIGYSSKPVLYATIDMSSSGIPSERQATMQRQVLEQVRALPGAGSAASMMLKPLSGSSWNDQVIVAGFNPKDIQESLSWMNAVSDGFFETMGIPFVAGRDFNNGDRPTTPKVAIVNEAFAKHYYGMSNVLGKEFAFKAGDEVGPPVRIVGVVGNTKYTSVKSTEDEPIGYLALSQDSAPGARMSFAIRSASGDPTAMVTPFKQLAERIDPSASLDIVGMDRKLADSLTRERLLATLSGFFGALALVLAMIGLYGIMAYNVARRRGEIGIRMALGSARSGVMNMVLREVSTLVVAGLVIGIIAVLMGMKLIKSFLFGLEPNDPGMLAVSALVLALVSIGAAALPAWRAGRVDPSEALRQE